MSVPGSGTEYAPDDYENPFDVGILRVTSGLLPTFRATHHTPSHGFAQLFLLCAEQRTQCNHHLFFCLWTAFGGITLGSGFSVQVEPFDTQKPGWFVAWYSLSYFFDCMGRAVIHE